MTIDEAWLNLTGGTGAANRLEKQLVADLAIALRIDKARIQVTSVRPEGGGVRASAELLILPGADDEPAAIEVAEALSMQAGTPNSMLHAMNSTRRAGDVRFREVQPAVLRGLKGGQSGPYQALLRGGVMVDDRGVRPTLSAVHGVASMQLKQNASGHGESGGYGAHASVNEALQVQQRDRHAMQMVEAARRHQEGFWVDVDSGIYQPVQTNKAYGTFQPQKQKKMPVWVWTTIVFGGTLFLALACWLVYFKFFLAPGDPDKSPAAAPAAVTGNTQAPVAAGPPSAPPHGNWADSAARAAVTAATTAQAAAHNVLNVFGKRPASANAIGEAPESTPATPDTAAAAAVPAPEADAAQTADASADTPEEPTPDA